MQVPGGVDHEDDGDRVDAPGLGKLGVEGLSLVILRPGNFPLRDALLERLEAPLIAGRLRHDRGSAITGRCDSSYTSGGCLVDESSFQESVSCLLRIRLASRIISPTSPTHAGGRSSTRWLTSSPSPSAPSSPEPMISSRSPSGDVRSGTG